MDATDHYLYWPVKRLKSELCKRGAVTTGRKSDLIERLTAYDKNQNFKNDVIINVPEPLEVNWPLCQGFRHLRKEHKTILPKLTKEQIEAYFLYRMAEDKEYSKDLKSITKGQLMYDSHRVLACSVLVKDGIFFSGVVGAAMKKKVTYNYKIKLEKESGDPVNTHCECPAGRGPHGTCKHVAAVLLMVVDLTTTGECIIDRSCTDTLMMFNKPKTSYSGSPVKADKLPIKRKLAADYLADPRPQKFRNCASYNDYVRNTITNFCSATSMDISFRYLYAKADIQSAVNDHDYCKLPFTEHWVDTANQVNQSDINIIEKQTQQQSNSSRWQEERKWRLTASTFGEICKVTSKRNTKKFCETLLNCSKLNSKAIVYGKNYEAKALRSFNAKFAKNAVKCGFYVSFDKPFLGASPDAVLDDGIVEIKCPYNGRNQEIKPGSNFRFLEYDENGNIVLKKK